MARNIVCVTFLISLIVMIFGFINDSSLYAIGGFAVSLISSIILHNQSKACDVPRTGGACKDVERYLSTNQIDLDWCNLSTDSHTNKNYITNKAARLFHPDMTSNINCSNDAKKAFQNVQNGCEGIYKNHVKPSNSFWKPSPKSNNTTYTPAPPMTPEQRWTKTYSSQTNTGYENVSDEELRWHAQAADTKAMQEMANRNFANNTYNTRTTKHNPDNDFCTIM